MEFQELVESLEDEPLFTTDLLFAGLEHPEQAQRQVADWTRAGRLVQVRRGLYALADHYRQRPLHPFVVANWLVPASYISLQIALSHYNLIPEHVAVVTGVTTGRPYQRRTPFGRFLFRHIQEDFFYGFEYGAVSQSARAFVALPEKALLDLVYLEPGGDDPAFLRSLRLQNLDRLDKERLFALAARIGKSKLQRAAERIVALVAEEASEYRSL